MNKYTCDYHIFGVEEGTYTVEAKDIFEALALCNLYLYGYSYKVMYEIKNIYLIDTYTQMD